MKQYLTLISGCLLATGLYMSYAANALDTSTQSSTQSVQQTGSPELVVLQASKAKISKLSDEHYQLVIQKADINHVLKFNRFPFGNASYVSASQLSEGWHKGHHIYHNGTQMASLNMDHRVMGIDITNTVVTGASVTYEFDMIKNSENPLPLCGNIRGMSKVSLCNKLYTTTLVASSSGAGFLPG